MKADKQTETEVMAAVNGFIEAYTRRDVEGTLALLSPEVFFFGSGVDEKRAGLVEAKAQIERDFEQAGEMSVELEPLGMSAAGAAAWVAADSTWRVKTGAGDMKYDLRWTLVLEKRQGKWLIAQSHLSSPAGSQAEGQSFPSQ